MNRCLRAAAALAAGWVCAHTAALAQTDEITTPSSSATTSAGATSSTLVPMAFMRQLPPTSLRGELVLTNPPEVRLNGKTDRLAPGARIRGMNNMLVMPGAAIGQKLVVNYTRESYGLILDVWVLRPDEAQKRWPKTPEEASSWTFDPLTQTWTK